jgi:predicted nucleotidyltransferase
MLWDESDHDGVEVFEVPVESTITQETFEEFSEREGYDEGRTQEIWEDGARRGAEWQREQFKTK